MADCWELLLIVGLGILVYAQFQFWNRPVAGDTGKWEYLTQVVARGGVPYRDAVDHKTPLAAYIGAAGVLAGRLLGLRDIFAMRATYVGLALLTVLAVYLVARAYSGSRRVGVLAAFIMLGFDFFAASNSAGVQPKTPMALFGLLSLWAVRRGRPSAAGLWGMLAALCWQPGLLFVGAAGLARSRYLTRWRARGPRLVAAGAALPLGITLAYFGAAGALADLYAWTIDFNLRSYGPGGLRTLETAVDRLVGMLAQRFAGEVGFFALGLLGLLLVLGRGLRSAFRPSGEAAGEALAPGPLVVAPLVYLAFCLVSLQSPDDLIPLLPFVAIFAAAALLWPLDAALGLIRPLRSGRRGPAARLLGSAVVGGLVFALGVADTLAAPPGADRLAAQDRAVAEIAAELGEGDEIFSNGAAEVLVLAGRMNADRFFFVQRFMDDYLDQTAPGGFRGWVEQLKAKRPRVVVTGNRRGQRHPELEAWLAAEYELRPEPIPRYVLRVETR